MFVCSLCVCLCRHHQQQVTSMTDFKENVTWSPSVFRVACFSQNRTQIASRRDLLEINVSAVTFGTHTGAMLAADTRFPLPR